MSTQRRTFTTEFKRKTRWDNMVRALPLPPAAAAQEGMVGPTDRRIQPSGKVTYPIPAIRAMFST